MYARTDTSYGHIYFHCYCYCYFPTIFNNNWTQNSINSLNVIPRRREYILKKKSRTSSFNPRITFVLHLSIIIHIGMAGPDHARPMIDFSQDHSISCIILVTIPIFWIVVCFTFTSPMRSEPQPPKTRGRLRKTKWRATRNHNRPNKNLS